MKKTITLLCVICIPVLSACKETILHDLSESQANQVIVVLAKSNIEAQKVRASNQWNIEVPKKQIATALGKIQDSRVLRNPEFQTSKRQNLIMSREEKSHYLTRATEGNLENTLERLPNVLEARVHLNYQKSKDKNKPLNNSASVLIISQRPEEISIGHIKKLIAGGAGIEENFISVLHSPLNTSNIKPQQPEVLKKLPKDEASSKTKEVNYSPLPLSSTTRRVLYSATSLIILGVVLVQTYKSLINRTIQKESTPQAKPKNYQEDLREKLHPPNQSELNGQSSSPGF